MHFFVGLGITSYLLELEIIELYHVPKNLCNPNQLFARDEASRLVDVLKLISYNLEGFSIDYKGWNKYWKLSTTGLC